jgi:hypothetical protein
MMLDQSPQPVSYPSVVYSLPPLALAGADPGPHSGGSNRKFDARSPGTWGGNYWFRYPSSAALTLHTVLEFRVNVPLIRLPNLYQLWEIKAACPGESKGS